MLAWIGAKLGAAVGARAAKWILVGLAALAIVSIVGGAYAYVHGLSQDLADERAARQTAEQTARINEATVAAQRQQHDDMVAAMKETAAALERLQRAQAEAGAEISRLGKIFAQHDLGKLANEKPGLIERRVDRGSDRINCLLERASGAKRDCDGAGAEKGAGDDPGAAPAR